MAQAVRHRSFTAEVRGRFQVILYEIYGEQSPTGTDFFLVLRFSPVSIIQTMLLTHFHLRVTLTRMTNG
jgi:hypothetical protein